MEMHTVVIGSYLSTHSVATGRASEITAVPNGTTHGRPTGLKLLSVSLLSYCLPVMKWAEKVVGMAKDHCLAAIS